tara:strand:- start:271 stop:717 length:447 start_codon:yes stop_codon:yes gene_type:complete
MVYDMAYSGRFRPTNITKYRGDHRNIIYRSLWERKFMKYCDRNNNILEWGSEEVIIPYRSPLDNRIHRYFPDFYIKLKDRSGSLQKYIIEIKPKKQCKEPVIQRVKTKKYIREVMEYTKNQAKWNAATTFCKDRMMEFKILTEDNLGV